MCTFSQPVQVSEAAKAKFPAAAVVVALILGNLAASCHAFSEFSGIRAWYAATFRFGMMGGYILILGLVAYPDRTMEQTRFVYDCCREIAPRPRG